MLICSLTISLCPCVVGSEKNPPSLPPTTTTRATIRPFMRIADQKKSCNTKTVLVERRTSSPNKNNKSNNQTVYSDDKKSFNTQISLLLLFRFVVYQISQPWTHPPQIRECREIENLGKIPGFWSSPILHLHLIKCFN